MKKAIGSLFLATLLCLTGVGRAEAQLGAILDWIYKLSGPGVLQLGGTGAFPLPTENEERAAPGAFRVRLSAMIGTTIDKSEEVAPPGGDIFLLTGQGLLEYNFSGGAWSIGAGAGVHWFFGDVDAFFKPYFTLPRLMWRPFRRRQGWERGLTFGASAYHYLKWDAEDFQPLEVDVSRDGGEWTWGLLAIYEIKLPRIQ
jgi:hypothetical protein